MIAYGGWKVPVPARLACHAAELNSASITLAEMERAHKMLHATAKNPSLHHELARKSTLVLLRAAKSAMIGHLAFA